MMKRDMRSTLDKSSTDVGPAWNYKFPPLGQPKPESHHITSLTSLGPVKKLLHSCSFSWELQTCRKFSDLTTHEFGKKLEG